MLIHEALGAMSARLYAGSMDSKFEGVTVDSRQLERGHLFFALRGEKADGHDFVQGVLRAGAAGVVVERTDPGWVVNPGQVILLVENSLKSLQRFAAHRLKQLNVPVVAVTGSSGKTTTKDLIAAVLGSRFSVLKTAGNYNNELGLPLTLCRLREDHNVAVLEMGMRGIGQIRELCQIAPPTIGVITAITGTHYELLGSMENIAKAKGELLEALPAEGRALLNGDNEWCRRAASKSRAPVSFFGLSGGVDYQADNISFSAAEGSSFSVRFGRERQKFVIPLLGEHNVRNSLAAIGVGVEFGIPPAEMAFGLEKVTLSGMRQEQLVGRQNILILDDTYNANPDSMLAALKVLKKLPGKRRVAVLGDMLELGQISVEKHREVGLEAARLGLDFLITVGERAEDIARGANAGGMEQTRIFQTADVKEAEAILDSYLRPKDVVLVKASRGMRLEQIVRYLQEER